MNPFRKKLPSSSQSDVWAGVFVVAALVAVLTLFLIALSVVLGGQ